MTVRLGIDTDRLQEGAERAKAALAGVGKAVAGLGVGVPAAAGVATAVGGMAAAFASAGLAAKAFQLAAGPQLESVTEAATSAEKAEQAHELATRKKAEAQKLATKGGDEYKAALKEAKAAAEAATEADAEHEAQLAGMPKTTRTMAKEFLGLKSDYEDWSESMSGSTMPAFTRGLQILRSLLPTLTPFVEQASKAFGGFLDRVAAGVKSAGFKQWADDMSAVSGTSLSNFLEIIKNLALGFGGLLHAFAPASAGMTGGLVDMTAAFADWGTSLKDSEGFADFLALAKSGAETLSNLGGAAIDLLVALGPLIGVTTQLVSVLALMISAVPTPVLTALASTLFVVRAGMMAYAAGSKVVTAANAVMRSSVLRNIGAWLRLAAVSVGAMARTAAAAVANAARTAAAWAMAAARATATWLMTILRVAAVSIAQFVMMAARAVVWAATMAAQWLIAMGPVGWIIAAVIALVALIVANWDKIKKYTLIVWNWLWAKIKSVANFIWNLFLNWTIVGRIIKHWDQIKAKTIAVWNAVVAWVKKVPGKLADLFLNWTIVGRIIKHWDQIKAGTIRVATSMVAWVRGLPGRITRALGNLGSLLYDKGKDIVRGLWNGIQGMGRWLRSTLMSWAKNLIPGPIAKALGIASPSKLLADQVGRWLPPGVAEGAMDNIGPVEDMAGAMAAAAVPELPTGTVRGMSRVRGHQERLVIDVTGGDEDLAKLIRKWVNDRGGPTRFFATT
ncbi:hypothetical protein [Streptomyces sp. CNQ085]|uniref:phage tail protein n=1 Tax=Streptomyces sp. CNQ085 TaxID=2886944 RepID=UPI001F511227|nr:hypothetical protein [Streptomyces sp. CNQ085]MCI0384593.1 hypothetical protein [Streptomyces sp. CNQ085]